MPPTRTVRVTRTWDIAVPAVYGDTDKDLHDKVTVTENGYVETRNLLPEEDA